MPRPSAREQILDAYREILIEHGPVAVTLEAVAARAEVSKGGLLYHFGSKDALLDGLLERVRTLHAEDVELARKAPDGPVRYYLRTSISDAKPDNPAFRTLLAVIRMSSIEPKVSATLRECTEDWHALIAESVTDPLTAELITLVGDGLYLRAAIDDGRTEPAADLDFDEVLRRLKG
ncbi:TetR/AcrR family transcriptional regulator [Amycolatopsis suaedae]|uniref:TetR/AcrR family transcriptional regulator n=1 Tax=Amycolatopsis suaedae TaxID=2510978 RepID=A0A4Q7JBL2_9PSEU|nr:TetR/AcrR family transcriptional regulator [Amycolatopsis suaedae]RZQ65220.1 TetR/AcrR family transcriptional regulator [Amycolatopsis suaedae]